MVCLENTNKYVSPVKNQFFLHSYHHLSNLNTVKFFSSWILQAQVLSILETLKTKCWVIYEMCCIVLFSRWWQILIKLNLINATEKCLLNIFSRNIFHWLNYGFSIGSSFDYIHPILLFRPQFQTHTCFETAQSVWVPKLVPSKNILLYIHSAIPD